MAYGLKYQAEFKNIPLPGGTELPYRVEILQKDYAGGFSTITLSGTPCLPSYQTDDIRAPIAGFGGTLSIINSGPIPLTSFYSVNDDEWQVIFYQGSNVLGVFYVIQDDSNELMVDFAHDITIQYNDNLGLLKDVAFNKNTTVITDYYARNSLAACIHQCLKNTNLSLVTNVFVNMWENRMSEADSLFPQTYIDLQTFISGEVFMSCYDVLTRILDRFNCSLFQAGGTWNIVRWDELRGLTTIHSFIYNSDWVLTGSGLLDTPFVASANIPGATVPDSVPEFGLRRQGIRPFLFDKETFNYVQPKYLLKNYDLQTLGALIRTYVVDVRTFSEYVAIGWLGGWTTNTAERFIRVVTDTLGNELDRYLVVRNTTTDSARSVLGTPFEVSKGDKVKFSFSVRTNISQGGSLTIIFALGLYNGTTVRYVDENPAGNGAWIPNIGFNYTYPSGDNTDIIHSVEIPSGQIPFDGLIYPYLAEVTQGTQNSSKETHYKDIRMEYTPYINDSTKIIGHIHKDIQTDPAAADTKNNEDITVFMDDSPRNSIQGTLFLSTFTGLIQNRTALWHRAGYTEALKIGQIMTTETLQWRSIPRTKLEGDFRGLVQSNIHLSRLTVLKFTYLNPLRFIFGILEYNYRENKWHCTAWELTGQNDEPAVPNDYTFTYIYATQ